MSEEVLVYFNVLTELFEDRLGEGSYVASPIAGTAMEKLVIGKDCFLVALLLLCELYNLV